MLIRKRNGGALAESAAALTVMLPVVVCLAFVILEVSQAYLIKTSLAQGARQAARDLAIAYGKDPLVASNRAMQESQAFDHIRIHNLINDSAQFDDAVFDTAAVPHTVTVKVLYKSGQHGLPAFPNPDPLHMAGKLQVFAESVYRLE